MIYIAMAKDTRLLTENHKTKQPKNASELLYCYSNLHRARTFCNNIDKMILLNFEDRIITKKDLEKYWERKPYEPLLSSVKEDREADIKVLGGLKVFNKGDLGIVKEDASDFTIPDETSLKDLDLSLNVEGFSLKDMDLKLLKDSINNEPVFAYFSTFSLLFLNILSELNNVTIYRKSFLRSRSRNWGSEPESKVKDYFLFRKSLQRPSSSLFDNSVPSTFLDCFKKKETRHQSSIIFPNEQFYKDFSSLLSGSIKKAVLFGSDEFIIKYMLADLEKKLATTFLRPNVGTLNTEGTLSGNKILIQEADELNVSACNKVIDYANSDGHENDIILLQSGVPITNLHDASFKVILMPSMEQIQSVLPKIVLFIIKEYFGDSPKWKLNKKEIRNFHKQSVRKIFKIIRSLTEIENEIRELKYKRTFSSVDFSDEIFWWEFKNYIDGHYSKDNKGSSENVKEPEPKKEIEPEQENKSEEKTELIKEEKKLDKVLSKPVFSIKKFIFTHNEDDWEITSSEFEGTLKEEYKSSLILKYITYLAKHCKSPNGDSTKIKGEELYEIVTKWHGIYNPDKHYSSKNISQDFRSYVNKYSDRNKNLKRLKSIKKIECRDKLVILRDHFIFKDYCYYDPKFDPDYEIKIEVHDKDMPLR